jgi:hypothetical protein
MEVKRGLRGENIRKIQGAEIKFLRSVKGRPAGSNEIKNVDIRKKLVTYCVKRKKEMAT